MFGDIINTITAAANASFEDASKMIEDCVNADAEFIDTLQQIGTIPESVAHDSTEEKLFSKASDAVLSRAFREIGLCSTILRERGDSADVLARSPIHGYALVADAKAFRMSRTAKNQKDFKVVALSGWRKDTEYAVLCSPYFQYPAKTSQIYAQAIVNNVCLLSWEHLVFMIRHGIKESKDLSLADLWGFCGAYSHEVLCSDMKTCFLEQFNDFFLQKAHLNRAPFDGLLREQIEIIVRRGEKERSFWIAELEEVKQYSREKAIRELIKSKKIYEKIAQIDTYVRGLSYEG